MRLQRRDALRSFALMIARVYAWDNYFVGNCKLIMMHRQPEQPVVTIRRATRDDVAHIVRLLADDALGQLREAYAEPLPNAYYAAFARIDADQQHQLVVAEAGHNVIGTLHLTFLPSLSFQGGTRAQIESVRVDQAFRNQGIGQALVRWAIEQARQAQCHVVQLTTHATRQDAHRFYTRLGFTPSHIGMKLQLDHAYGNDHEQTA